MILSCLFILLIGCSETDDSLLVAGATSLSGVVIDTHDNPVADLPLFVQYIQVDPDGAEATSGSLQNNTDTTGHFSFSNIAPGQIQFRLVPEFTPKELTRYRLISVQIGEVLYYPNDLFSPYSTDYVSAFSVAAGTVLEDIQYMLGHSRYNRRLHRVSAMFQTLFEDFAEVFKAENPNHIYSIDTYPVAVCDTIRISRSRLYKGESWRGKIASKHRYFYGIKAHLMVTETGHIVEAFLTPGRFSDVRGLGRYRFDLPTGSVVYADKAYCDYGIEDVLEAADIHLKPLRKKNSKRQYPPWEVYLQHAYRKRVGAPNNLLKRYRPCTKRIVSP